MRGEAMNSGWRTYSSGLLLVALCNCDVILGVDGERGYCEEGQFSCSDNAPRRCGANLEWEEPLSPCGGNSPVCSQGKCVSVLQIDAGGRHTCAVLEDHTVACWGANHAGQLGDRTLKNRSAAVVVAGLTNVRKVVVGGPDISARSCALLEDETVKCWGGVNGFDVFSDGSNSNQLEPETVPGLSEVQDLALGSAHSCALIRGGVVKCWGMNNFGPAGQNNVASPTVYSPMPVPGLGPVKSISAGGAHTCAITMDDRITCWGSGALGQCGVDWKEWDWGNAVPPSQAVRDLDEVESVDTGYYHTCAVGRYQGRKQAVCWGAHDCGQLGGIDHQDCDMTQCAKTPTALEDACRVSAPTVVWSDPDEAERSRAHSPTLGGRHTCILTREGRVKCWGRNNFYQCKVSGMGTVSAWESGIDDFAEVGYAVEVSAGSNHTCARRESGDVVCWGQNQVGECGVGTFTPSSLPLPVHWRL